MKTVFHWPSKGEVWPVSVPWHLQLDRCTTSRTLLLMGVDSGCSNLTSSSFATELETKSVNRITRSYDARDGG